MLLAFALSACGSDETNSAAPTTDTCSGDVLFGRPNESTGLSDEQCQPRCACGGSVEEAKLYTEADADALLTWTLIDPPAPLTSNSYDDPAPAEASTEVCAMIPDASASRSYTLHTYPTDEDAEAAGAIVTHFGACGVCSPLVDLAVYMRHPDLTTPVRDCGLKNLTGTEESHVQCLQDLGFSLPCAQIWYFNTIHTRDECTSLCFSTLGDPYHLPDGSLNACLQCDEDKSGPTFKAVAGRTRRNTGLASALCRPCSEVRPLAHDYP